MLKRFPCARKRVRENLRSDVVLRILRSMSKCKSRAKSIEWVEHPGLGARRCGDCALEARYRHFVTFWASYIGIFGLGYLTSDPQGTQVSDLSFEKAWTLSFLSALVFR